MYCAVPEPGFLDLVEPVERNVLKGIAVTPHLELALSKPRLAKLYTCAVDERRMIRHPTEYIETATAEQIIRDHYGEEDVPYMKNVLYALHGIGPQHQDTQAILGAVQRPPLSKMHDVALELRSAIFAACGLEGLFISGGVFLVFSRPQLSQIR